MNDCPDIMELETYVLGDGEESMRVSIGAHVLKCTTCAQEIAELSENLKMASALRREGGLAVDHELPQMMSSGVPSELIGPYRIIRAIGQGGMGTVYEAQQENPRRVVALKMMRPGLVSRSLLSRFRHEAQILGRLRHPGIAQIYEAGTHQHNGQPQPYFVMELVRGKTLVKFAEQKKLGRRDRMELMARICDAVHHAHQHGVIHRDLKPDNILIDESQSDSLQPKILDFGVARIIDPESQTQTLHTSAGQIVGTVAYMSPEQANADPGSIDTRSDVYALGVICYQLVSGQLPYRLNTASVAESVRAIVQDEPTPLSTVDRSLRGDVTTIVGKALEKDRARRYQSAAEMAADIRRHLRDEPVTAVPPSTIYQVRKFARRNKGLVAGIALAFVLLICGVIGTSIGLVRAKRALTAADLSATEARREADKAKAINQFLDKMLASANPHSATVTNANAGRDVKVVQLLDDASKQLDAGELTKQPAVEAAVRRTLASTYGALAQFPAAEQHVRKALLIHRELYGNLHAEVADDLDGLAILLHGQGRFPEAKQFYLEALETRRNLYPTMTAELAESINNYGAILKDTGNLAEAEQLFLQALDARRKLF
ncbi:MAG: serine/threonine protein kinase, partial [Anaerolineae bacterium]|nr:serine/threonine protein kinase [Phycisphaerae bacterium]